MDVLFLISDFRLYPGLKITFEHNSFRYSVFRYSKVFRLHAILHDAAGAVRSHTGKGPGYCYKIGRGPNSCLLGHVADYSLAFS